MFTGAGAAEGAALLDHFALEVDAFAALGTDAARSFEAGQIFRLDFDLHPFFGKKHLIRELRISLLLGFFFRETGEELFGGLLGRFLRGDANSAAGLQVAEGSGDLAPVAEFQGALAESAIRDEGDGIGDATIDLHEGDEAFAVGNGIVDAKFFQAEHGQANAEDLASADVTVGDGGEVEVLSEGFHGRFYCSAGVVVRTAHRLKSWDQGTGRLRGRSQQVISVAEI